MGTFHNVSKRYLHLYVAEFQFRYNNRFNDDIFGTAIEGRMRQINTDILIGILIASLGWVAVFVWQSSQPPNHTSAASQHCEGTKSECAKATTDDRIADYTWWLAVLTGGLVFAGIIQFGFLIRSDNTARLAANAAERAADATAASVDLARDTAKRQLRAYVTVNGVIRTKDPGDLNGQGFAVLVDIKNSGQTPARDSLQWARIEIQEFPLTTHLPIHCLENPTKGILPPEAKNLAFPTFTRDLTTIEENAILANHTAIYVYGEIDYLDAFGDRHLTQFRFRCNGQGYPLGMFKPDCEGNEAT